MVSSKHNIIFREADGSRHYVINLLSGNADLLSAEELAILKQESFDPNNEQVKEAAVKGYLVDPAAEETLYREKYLDFIDNRDKDELQLFYVPTYACNFNCAYCYQEGYAPEKGVYHPEVLSAFFDYIKKHFAGRRKYVTVFGGEPLLASARAREHIQSLLNECEKNNLTAAIVTNGYTLTDYLPIFKPELIREVQVTLDGPRAMHDRRRALKGGKGTFDQIVKGIDKLLQKQIPVNLRVVLDRENSGSLPELAAFAQSRGWTSHPLFKTQLGRNYELHYCQRDQSKLYDRLTLYQELAALIKKHPVILDFHKPACSVSRFLFENGELPEPLFDSCPGTKTEWAFDFCGRIYACTATVGKKGEELGTFYPEVSLDKNRVNLWSERDVTEIAACQDCRLRLACGGGCAAIAKNEHGQLNAPDCRPVQGLLEIGMSMYHKT